MICVSFYNGLWILFKMLSMNPMQPINCHKCVPKDTFSSTMGHWISLLSALLMHDAMNNASCRFRPIPHECVILNDVVMLHVNNEIKETLFKCQLGWFA